MLHGWAHARHVRTRSAEHASSTSGGPFRQNEDDWFGLPQRRVGHEGLEVPLHVLTSLGPAHLISPPAPRGIDVASQIVGLCFDQSLTVGGPILASNPGSILASVETPNCRKWKPCESRASSRADRGR